MKLLTIGLWSLIFDIIERNKNGFKRKNSFKCGKKMSILQEKDINKIFENLKFNSASFLESKENIFNKFMHGDFIWIKKFIEKEKKIIITSDEKATRQFVAYPNTISNFLFEDILEATYKMLLLLYPCNK